VNSKKQKEIIQEQPLTYEDYGKLPEDGNRYELANGKLELMSPSASVRHQLISFQLQKNIAEGCESEYFILVAPIDVILSPIEVRQPDLVMIHRSRMHIMKNRGIDGAPDLVVEILSPSSIKRDRVGKLKTYAHYGIPEYWIVDPFNNSLEQYFLDEEKYELEDVYVEDDKIRSKHVLCVSFSMNVIMRNIPVIQD
jgi:Uma2 family endonuclease